MSLYLQVSLCSFRVAALRRNMCPKTGYCVYLGPHCEPDLLQHNSSGNKVVMEIYIGESLAPVWSPTHNLQTCFRTWCPEMTFFTPPKSSAYTSGSPRVYGSLLSSKSTPGIRNMVRSNAERYRTASFSCRNAWLTKFNRILILAVSQNPDQEYKVDHAR